MIATDMTGTTKPTDPPDPTTAPARFIVLWERPTDPEAFEHHYRDVHIPLARKIPGLRSYAICDDPLPVRGEPCFRVAELRWDTMDDLRTGFASPEGRATADDVVELTRYAGCRSFVVGPFEELL
jgi:uncharacterized protein (TIGR02118 family)